MAQVSARLPSDFKEITDTKTCLEGILAELFEPSDLTKWRVFITAPDGSPFEGGIFETKLDFPPEYPMAPPELHFISEFFHPNVYPDGKVCISILHPPGKDVFNEQERPEERWMPAHSPCSIFNCFLTLLEEPNIHSPANLDASIMWRDKREDFIHKAREIVASSKKNLPAGVLDRLPRPDTNPLQRARRVKDKLDLLEANDPQYNKKKAQLEKVIYDVLHQLSDKSEAESLYRNFCPRDDDQIESTATGDGGLANFDDDDDGGVEFKGFSDEENEPV